DAEPSAIHGEFRADGDAALVRLDIYLDVVGALFVRRFFQNVDLDLVAFPSRYLHVAVARADVDLGMLVRSSNGLVDLVDGFWKVGVDGALRGSRCNCRQQP